jgi:hypothetical protein
LTRSALPAVRDAHSSYMSMRTLTHEGVKLYRFAGILPALLTEVARRYDAVVAADQDTVNRYLRDDLAGFVHDASHVALRVVLVRPIA